MLDLYHSIIVHGPMILVGLSTMRFVSKRSGLIDDTSSNLTKLEILRFWCHLNNSVL